MSSFLGALGDYLENDSAVNALVGTSIYAYPAPQDQAYPYVILTRVSGQVENNISESMDNINETWQADIYSDSYGEADDIEQAVTTALNALGYTTMGNFFVYSVQQTNVNDLSSLERDNSQNKIVRIQSDYLIRRDRLVTT